MASRLSREDWVRTALDVIADRGVDSVVIDDLAELLGATKGSFYWHFPSREALLVAAVELWEEERTAVGHRLLVEVANPRERLRQLFAEAFAYSHAGRIEAAFVAHADVAGIGPVIRRTTRRRIEFTAAALRSLGLRPAQARRRAQIAYGAYLGLYALRVSDAGEVPVDGRRLSAFVDELLNVLTTN
jgi:AcrR family transcriptional regulator